MAFASNIAAMNAARKILNAQGINSAALKEFFLFEKHDGEWHALQCQPFPGPRDPLSCLLIERDACMDAIAFPKAAEAAFHEAQAAAAEQIDIEAAQAAADRLADIAQSATSLPNGKEWIRMSSIPKPTKQVWHIADEMNARSAAAGQSAPSRKEVQDECVRRGIASGTARTQYQAWKKATDESTRNAVHAAELSAKFNQK